MVRPDLSIVIVTYNALTLLETCINSIYRSTQRVKFEIIFVDNGSVDRTKEWVLARLPECTLIENRHNVGFAKANNQAMRIAKGRYCLLLGADTEILPGVFDRMVDFMDSHQEVGIAGCKLLNPDFTDQGTARSFPTAISALFGRRTMLTRLFPSCRFVKRYLTGLFVTTGEPFEVDWVSGTGLTIRREAIEDIGLLDEGFFMYWEDADWCHRAKERGWKVYCVPQAQVLHYEGKSSTNREKGHGQGAYTGQWRYILEFHKSVFRYYCKHCAKSWLHPMRPVAFLGLSLRAGTLIALDAARRTVGEWTRQ